MKTRKMALTSYLIIFLACVWSCTNTAYMYTQNEYAQAIETLKYQMSNVALYASESSQFNEYETQAHPSDPANPAPESSPQTETKEKVAYLTFDDGPSPRTAEILDILAKYDIKATFFVVTGNEKQYPEYIKRAYDEGHTIGVHTHSHKYKQIYSSVQSYLDDFNKCYESIYKITGTYPTIFRFPGGSVNGYNKSTCVEIVDEMTRRGFVYFDWNVESSDSTGSKSASTIYNNVVHGAKGKERAVIIMHDSITQKSTVAALEDIILTLKEEGFEFKPLTNEVKPVIFKMKQS